MTTAAMGRMGCMFALLHHVCTRIPGKVQTKITAITEGIWVLDRYVQRYVPLKVLICTEVIPKLFYREGETPSRSLPQGERPGHGQHL